MTTASSIRDHGKQSTKAIFAIAASIVGLTIDCGVPNEVGTGANVDENLGVTGQLVVYVADNFDGQSETHYALRISSDVERPLFFNDPVQLTPGTALKVWGVSHPGGINVTSFQTLPPGIERSTLELINGAAFRPRTFAFVLIDTGTGINVTPAGVLSTLMGSPTSLRNYYLSDSYGQQDITVQVFGPVTYSPLATCTPTDTASLARSLRPMISDTTFDHYLWYLGSRQQSCVWSGLASVGTPDAPSRDTWFNAATGCVVLAQEPGHNFGMQHSSSLICAGASFADDPNTCAASEYGDAFDTMGSGCRHMNAWQKEYRGWFGGCNGVSVTASGTFTLLPIETRCDGAQFLKIKSPKARSFNRAAAGGGAASVEMLSNYYVELRTPIDFDGTLANRTALQPQILVHAGADIPARNRAGLHTYLLDMNPSRTGDAALAVGSTFTDPAGGLSITTVSVSAAQATVRIEVAGGTGDPSCLDGSAFAAPGPGPESCAAPGTIDLGGAGGNGGESEVGIGGGTGGFGGNLEPDGSTQVAADGGAEASSEPGSTGRQDGCSCQLAQGSTSDPARLIWPLVSIVVAARRRRKAACTARTPRGGSSRHMNISVNRHSSPSNEGRAAITSR